MFLNKVHDQKLELLRAVFKNMYLKEKRDYLDGECEMLAGHILSNQVIQNENGEKKRQLEHELEALRQSHENKMHQLVLAKEKVASSSLLVDSSTSSSDEHRSIDDQLEIKNDMIQCLQEELIRVRLDAAENWALILELKRIKEELENDKAVLTKTKPKAVAQLQEELIAAKLLEIQYSLEFENVKRQLQKMKAELDVCHKNDSKTNNGKPEGKVKISRKGVFWQNRDKNEDKQIAEEEIEKLEKEKSFLQSKIPELQNRLQILQTHIEFKESERKELQTRLDNTKINIQNIEKITVERKRQYDHLENSASEKVLSIRNSSKEKVQDIDELSRKFEDLSGRKGSIVSMGSTREFNTIRELEEEIVTLEDRISQLKSEATRMKTGDCFERTEKDI